MPSLGNWGGGLKIFCCMPTLILKPGLALLCLSLLYTAHSGTLMLSTPPNSTNPIEPCTLTYDQLAAMMDSVYNEEDNPI